ncbi:MAG: hypothetical protein JHC95_12825 [Solirubrobacteraceae bacterium]|nr:hypothetical protein [Solirubrobacteraceae bacterium]
MTALELAGKPEDLLDEPVDLRLRGAGPNLTIVWRARVRDDDGRVWRASAGSAAGLDEGWKPAKPTEGVAALRSLRPVRMDVRAETPDGRTASRTVTRRLLADGVRVRRWRPAGAVYLPAEDPLATIVLAPVDHAALAAALLASRGVLVLVGGDEQAREQLAAVAGATEPRAVDDLPVPPGVPAAEGDAAADAAAWDALLAELGATPRRATAAGT